MLFWITLTPDVQNLIYACMYCLLTLGAKEGFVLTRFCHLWHFRHLPPPVWPYWACTVNFWLNISADAAWQPFSIQISFLLCGRLRTFDSRKQLFTGLLRLENVSCSWQTNQHTSRPKRFRFFHLLESAKSTLTYISLPGAIVLSNSWERVRSKYFDWLFSSCICACKSGLFQFLGKRCTQQCTFSSTTKQITTQLFLCIKFSPSILPTIRFSESKIGSALDVSYERSFDDDRSEDCIERLHLFSSSLCNWGENKFMSSVTCCSAKFYQNATSSIVT